MSLTSAEPITVDVVVVGHGAAGMAAAITAHDAGAELIVLEKLPEDQAGGNTCTSGQVWFSPTDAEMAKTFLHSMSWGFSIPDVVVDAWARETAKNTEWIRNRLAETAGYSRLYWTLKAAMELRGIEVRYDTPALRLIQSDEGDVVGLRASTPEGEVVYRARRGVILACGGFENNKQMTRDYLQLPDAHPWGSPGNTGDGHRMAQKVGADLWHMGSYCGVPGIAPREIATALRVEPRGNSHITVGNDGRRFINELIGWRHGKIPNRGWMEHWPGIPMHHIFDRKALDAGPLCDPMADYAGAWHNIILGYEWSKDNLVELEHGWIMEAETLSDLANKLGVPSHGLEQAVREYNAACGAGRDEFGRPPETLEPIDGPLYYGYSWGQVLIYTCGGPRKDAHGCVLDPFGQVIPGLYGAGEISSTYSWLTAGGMMIGDGLAFGRLAARHATELL